MREDVGSERVQSLVDRGSKSLAVFTVGTDRKQKFTHFKIKSKGIVIEWIPQVEKQRVIDRVSCAVLPLRKFVVAAVMYSTAVANIKRSTGPFTRLSVNLTRSCRMRNLAGT